MTDQPAAPSAASYFRNMADQIDHNASAGFGGAFVIVAPGDDGAIELLQIASNVDSSMFWKNLDGMCKAKIEELDRKNRHGAAFGRS
jgi:hypothetical protein